MEKERRKRETRVVWNEWWVCYLIELNTTQWEMRRGLIHLNKTHTSFTQRLISFFFCLGLFTLSFYYIVKDQVQREKGIKEIRHSSFLFTGGSFHYSHSERYLQVIKVVPCASLPFSLPLFFHAVIMERSGSMNRMN